MRTGIYKTLIVNTFTTINKKKKRKDYKYSKKSCNFAS